MTARPCDASEFFSDGELSDKNQKREKYVVYYGNIGYGDRDRQSRERHAHPSETVGQRFSHGKERAAGLQRMRRPGALTPGKENRL